MKPFDKVYVTLNYQGNESLARYKGQVAEYLRPSKLSPHASWLRFQDGKKYLLYDRNVEPYQIKTNEEALLYLERMNRDAD